jgi:hypothetical protein
MLSTAVKVMPFTVEGLHFDSFDVATSVSGKVIARGIPVILVAAVAVPMVVIATLQAATV